MAETAKIIIKTEDQSSAALDDVTAATERATEGFKIAGAALTAVGVAGLAAINGWVQAFFEQEAAETRLTQIAKEVTGATDAQVQSMMDYASALQEVGIVGDDVLISGQSQLASFGLQAEQVEQLSSGLGDLLVANKGVNSTQNDAITSANALGKAIATGLLGPLELSGILLSQQQKDLFAVADQQERTNILTEVLAQNYGGLNEAMAATAQGGLQQMKNDFGDLSEELGEALIPILTVLMSIVNEVLGFFLGLGDGTKTVIAVMTLLATGIGLVGGPMLLMIGFLPTIITGLGSMAAAATVAWAAITGPVGLVIAAIVLLGVFFALLIKNWDDVVIAVQAAGEMLIDFFENMWNTITTITEFVWNNLVAFFENMWNTVVIIFETTLMVISELIQFQLDAWQFAIELVFNAILAFFTFIWEGIKLIFETHLAVIDLAWTTVWNGMKTLSEGVWNALKAGIQGVFDFFVSIIETFTAPITEGFQAIWDGLTGAVGIAMDSVTATLKAGLNAIISIVNSIIEKVNSVSGAAAAIIPGGASFQIPTIPHLAEGGIVTGPTLALIGEAGPEAVIPLSGANAGLAGGIVNNFLGPISSREVAMEYADIMTQGLFPHMKVS
ncbi:MAG: hypothetical protein V3T43_06170 [Nitrosomonadaceae bacterium]